MKFNLIISNPPYNSGLDLKILKAVYPLGKKICFIHPANWLYDNKKINHPFNSARELVKEHFVSYEKVENANKTFNIALFGDILITNIDKNKMGIGNKIYDIDVHSDSEIYKSLKNKILNYCRISNIQQRVSNTNNQKWEVGFSSISGGLKYYLMIRKTIESTHIGNTTDHKLKFGFDTDTEAINFKEYLKTKIARFCLSIYKMNQQLERGELAAVPYMPTYTRHWTDEDVAKELRLTDEELQWAINWIPDYYPEDKEKYKKYKLTK